MEIASAIFGSTSGDAHDRALTLSVGPESDRRHQRSAGQAARNVNARGCWDSCISIDQSIKTSAFHVLSYHLSLPLSHLPWDC